MQNVFLDARTAADIDRSVAKILRDLGNPEPPLRLEVVRDLLSLDRAYYSSADDGALAETIHRLHVAGKQILQRPLLLLDVVRRLDLKALWVPDRKRILIDSELPKPKQRWGEAHEIGHSIIPWHGKMMHGDKTRTLNFSCEQQLEAEANYAAGSLLFMQKEFVERLRSSSLSFDYVKSLSKQFGNSMTTTLWRAIEASQPPTFGLVSQHPRRTNGDPPVRYFVRSMQFERVFGNVTAREVFDCLEKFCYGNRGPIGSSEVLFRDMDGESHLFFVETFFNSYEALTIGTYRRVKAPAISVV